MTYEEYCEIIDKSDFYIDSENPYDTKIVEALEKQISKKPTYYVYGYADGKLVYNTWHCPNCKKGYEVDFDNYNFCPYCGQKIDRSEVKE